MHLRTYLAPMLNRSRSCLVREPRGGENRSIIYQSIQKYIIGA